MAQISQNIKRNLNDNFENDLFRSPFLKHCLYLKCADSPRNQNITSLYVNGKPWVPTFVLFIWTASKDKPIKDTVESLYLEPLYLEISLCRTKYLVPRMLFQANFLSLSRTLSISNKYFGPLKVRDREILLYISDLLISNLQTRIELMFYSIRRVCKLNVPS